MKKHLHRIFLFLAVVLSLGLVTGIQITSAIAENSGSEGKCATILFTHDMHSHLLPSPKEGGGEYGGFARLTTRLKEERAKAKESGTPSITVDGGDFSMGSLFQTVYTTEATELRSLGRMGYDVTTFGNHEYEYRASGFASMLESALKSGDPLPKIVEANYLPPNKGDEKYDENSSEAAKKALNDYGVTPYTMVEKDGVRFAVFGVFGQDSDDCAPMSGMNFEPVADAAKRVIAEIKEKEKYDFIICLSHSGTNADPAKSEDELLAKNVDGIDFIVSGHTHSTMTEPKIINNTIIGCTGAYCSNLGKLTIQKDSDGNNKVVDYELLPIDATVKDDAEMASTINAYKNLVETEYLSKYNMKFDEVLAHSSFDFTPISKFGVEQQDDELGSIVADGYVHAVEEAEGGKGRPILAGFTNLGVIRATLAKGNITTSNAFDVSSIGSGADGSAGYPLIDLYLTGEEIKNVMEVDPSVGPLFEGAQLYSSGVGYKFNMNRMIFNRSYDPYIQNKDGSTKELEDDTLYRCVTNLYSSQMLGLVTDKSFGILQVQPKDENGDAITDYEARIIHDKNGNELKEWYALATYLQSFDKVNGVSEVPTKYSAPEGRKIRVDSINPIDLLVGANWVTFTVIGIVVALIALVVFIIYRIATHKKRKMRKAA